MTTQSILRPIASAIVALLLSSRLAAEPPEPPLGIEAEEFSARREKVLEELGKSRERPAILLLRNGAPSVFTGDVDHFPYRPDNDLLYLSGIEVERAQLLLAAKEIEGLGRAVLFLPPPQDGEGIWVSRRPGPAEASARSGIPAKSILRLDALRETLAKAMPPGRFHGFGGPEPQLFFDAGQRFRAGEPVPEGYGFLLGQLGSRAFHLELRSPGELTIPLRQLKSPAEIRLLRRAISITGEALRAAIREARPGAFEYQVAAKIEYEFRARGASGWSFPSIVGAGPDSCVLHHDRYDREIAAGDLVVMDVGAEYGFYAADVTRTVPATGRFSERQRRVYRIVLEAQEAAIRAIRPGVPHREVQRVASEVVSAGLIGLGLIQEASQVGKYLPHGVSHGLGMDVHDPMVDATLRAGMVITVEPGIYIPSEELGVRIEDDVLVTETGAEILSAGAPRDPDEIERWMRAESL